MGREKEIEVYKINHCHVKIDNKKRTTRIEIISRIHYRIKLSMEEHYEGGGKTRQNEQSK